MSKLPKKIPEHMLTCCREEMIDRLYISFPKRDNEIAVQTFEEIKGRFPNTILETGDSFVRIRVNCEIQNTEHEIKRFWNKILGNMITVIALTLDGELLGTSLKYQDLDDSVQRSGDWWYFHGELQNHIGYDKGLILETPGGDLEGEYFVTVIGLDKPCLGYFWIDSENRQRGLVCYEDDGDGLEYAKEVYKKRSTWL